MAAVIKFSFHFVTWTTHAATFGVTTLYHKAGNDAVKAQTIVKSLASQGLEVGHRVWCCIGV